LLIAAITGSMFTRMAAAEAFEKKGRSLATPDILETFDVSKYISKI